MRVCVQQSLEYFANDVEVWRCVLIKEIFLSILGVRRQKVLLNSQTFVLEHILLGRGSTQQFILQSKTNISRISNLQGFINAHVKEYARLKTSTTGASLASHETCNIYARSRQKDNANQPIWYCLIPEADLLTFRQSI